MRLTDFSPDSYREAQPFFLAEQKERLESTDVYRQWNGGWEKARCFESLTVHGMVHDFRYTFYFYYLRVILKIERIFVHWCKRAPAGPTPDDSVGMPP